MSTPSCGTSYSTLTHGINGSSSLHPYICHVWALRTYASRPGSYEDLEDSLEMSGTPWLSRSPTEKKSSHRYWLGYRIKDADTRCLLLTGRKALLLILVTFDSTWWHFITVDLPMNLQTRLYLCNSCGSWVMLQIVLKRKFFIQRPHLINYHILSSYLNCTHCITLMFKTCNKIID